MFNYMKAFGTYHFVMYKRELYILDNAEWVEYKTIPRTVTEKFDPYKFSVCKLSTFKNKVYINLINYEFEFPIGFKRDWEALKESIDEGIRIYREYLDKPKKQKKKKRFILI